MSELVEVLQQAYQFPDDQTITNKAHRLFLSHTFILPINKSSSASEPEVLFYQEGDYSFLPVFSNDRFFHQWAEEALSNMSWLHISGKDLILGMGENAYLCLDICQDHYKEFEPSEIIRLKQVVLKLEKIAKATAKPQLSETS